MTREAIRRENFEILHHRAFENDPSALRGRDIILKRFGTEKLSRLLRSHYIEPVEGRDIEERDDVDALLEFYALLETATICGYVPEQLPDTFAAETRRILEEPSVQRFYGRYYPLLLVQLFSERLASRIAVPSDDSGDATNAFLQFLDIAELLRTDTVETFLWFLDDGVVEGENFDDMVELLESPKSLAAALAARPDERSPSQKAIQGFRGFTTFARQLDVLLESTTMPLVRSAFWHFHGYWLRLVSDMTLGVMTAAIEQQRAWVEPRPRDGEEERSRAHFTQASMNRTEFVLQRLTSGIYRAPLEQFFFDRTVALTAGLRAPVRHSISKA